MAKLCWLPWQSPSLVVLFLERPPHVLGQPRAAQVACQGKVEGSACSYTDVDGMANEAVSLGVDPHGRGIPPMRGHCYLLDRWQAGGGGVNDVTGQSRLPSAVVCLEDGSFQPPVSATVKAVVSAGGVASNTGGRDSRGTEVFNWVIDGGWKVLAGCTVVFACILCSCLAMCARLSREDTAESSFVAKMPVVLGLGIPKPFRAERAAGRWKGHRYGKGKPVVQATCIGAKDLQETVADTKRKKATKPAKQVETQPQPAVHVAKQGGEEADDHYDIDRELREAGLFDVTEDQAAGTESPRECLAPRASEAQTAGHRNRKARGPPPPLLDAVPKLSAPPLPPTPVCSPGATTRISLGSTRGTGLTQIESTQISATLPAPLASLPPAPCEVPEPAQDDEDSATEKDPLANVGQRPSYNGSGNKPVPRSPKIQKPSTPVGSHATNRRPRTPRARENKRLASPPPSSRKSRTSSPKSSRSTKSSGNCGEEAPLAPSSHRSKALATPTNTWEPTEEELCLAVEPKSKWETMEDDLCFALEEEVNESPFATRTRE